jgi:hypothetical protein
MVVPRHASCGSVSVALPTTFEFSDNVAGIDLSHRELPWTKAGAQPVSQPSAGRADADGVVKIGIEGPIS